MFKTFDLLLEVGVTCHVSRVTCHVAGDELIDTQAQSGHEAEAG